MFINKKALAKLLNVSPSTVYRWSIIGVIPKPSGVKSKEFLVSLIGDKPIRCVHKDVDRYKRIVAECFANNINLNKELVKNGWALAYRDYSNDYVDDENFAKENALGMWKGTFIEPKKWRKLN